MRRLSRRGVRSTEQDVQDRHDGNDSPILLILSIPVAVAASLAACIPVPSVVGRGAGVVPVGEERPSFGGGFLYYREEVLDGRATSQAMPYVYGAVDFGLGGGSDVRIATCGIFSPDLSDTEEEDPFPSEEEEQEDVLLYGEMEAVYRVQLVGRPVSSTRWTEGAPLDLSLEVGTGLLWRDDTGFADLHVGANLSLAFDGWSPYVSYRHHFGGKLDADGEYQFQQQVFHVGVVIGGLEGAFAVELFRGMSPDPGLRRTELAYDTWGLNVVFRPHEF